MIMQWVDRGAGAMLCVLLGGPLDGDEYTFPGAPQHLRQPDGAELRGVHKSALGHYVYLRRDITVEHPDRLSAALRRNVDANEIALYDFRGWKSGRRK